MSADNKRTGFTVVEFVIVLIIVVVAIALLIPAVQRSRENARREACINNMKQLGLALHNYHDSHKRFPPSATLCSADGKPPYQAGGLSFLLEIYRGMSNYPFFDELLPPVENPAAKTSPTFYLTDTDAKLATLRDTLISELICPSNPNKHFLFPNNTAPGTKIALTNYKAMGATNMLSLSYCLDPDGTTASPYPPIPVVPSEHLDDGYYRVSGNKISPIYMYSMHHSSMHPDGVIFPGKGIRINDIMDGTPHTIMAVETIDDSGTIQSDAGSSWISGACTTLVGLPSENSGKQITYVPSDERYTFIRPEGFNGRYGEEADPKIQALRTYLAYDFSGADKGKYPDPATGTIVGNMPKNLCGPSSAHPGIVNHLYVDGAVRSLRKDIDFCAYLFLITRDNGDTPMGPNMD
jgi:type II secretory pathway pseudopilin PulG